VYLFPVASLCCTSVLFYYFVFYYFKMEPTKFANHIQKYVSLWSIRSFYTPDQAHPEVFMTKALVTSPVSFPCLSRQTH
jgi:hypothetical protein